MSKDSAESLKRKHEEDEAAETVKRKVVEPDEWVDAWKRDSIAFHEGVPNSMLVKNLDKLINGRSSVTVFVPLCGKAVDMKFLYDAGHTVVGVEVAEKALRDFFTENNMEYTVKKVNKSNAHVYKSSDGRIRLYCMDFYDFTRDVESGMQVIWDRASLVAINQEDPKKFSIKFDRYADLMVSLMAEDCRYLLHTLHYDEERFAGPPHSVSPKVVHELFKDGCNISEVETADMDDKRKTMWNLKELYESLFLIIPKTHEEEIKPETEVSTERTVEGWLEKWNKSDIAFHQGEPNKMLVKNLDKLVNGKSTRTIFFPLCGKAVDMKFVYDACHMVIGVEVAEKAVQEFFTENKLEYTVEKLDKIKGSLFKSSDGRIRLYCADLFDFSSELESTVQAIWDRASLVAVNVADRKKYADLMMDLMSDDCQYLLLAYNYDQEKYAGPPHAVDSNVVDQLFGERCNVKRLDGGNIFNPSIHREKFGLDWFDEELYAITLKS